MKAYYDKDANLDLIKTKKVAIIGYGSQGHAHALNLRDSGVQVRVGLRGSSTSKPRAEAEGLTVVEPREAAAWGDVVMSLVPDELSPEIFAEEIAPGLKPGDHFAVAHGFGVHFKKIVPAESVGVFLVAPKAPGHTVRREYANGRGVPMLIAVERDIGKTRDLALAYASAIGGGRAGILETSFKEETETDLFGEQTVLCGGCVELVKAGFDTLVEAGYAPEMAYFECLHELKLIVDLMYEGGIGTMNYSISNNAEYGEYVSGPKIIDAGVRARMKEVLGRIQSGDYAKEFVLENRAGAPTLLSRRRMTAELQIEKVGGRLREMMPWIRKNRLVDTAKN